MSHPKNSTRLQIHVQCTLFGMIILYIPNLNRQFGDFEYACSRLLPFIGDIRVRMLENEFGKEVFDQNKYQSFIPQDEKASASKYRLKVL